MATATLGNTPTTIHACDTDDWTGADGTDTEVYKENGTSIGWVARASAGSSDSCTSGTLSFSLLTEHVRLWMNHAAISNLDPESGGGMEFMMSDGTNTAYYIMFGSDTYAGGWFNHAMYGGNTPDSGTKPTGTITSVGFRMNASGLSANKVNTWFDYIRYGDGYYATGGSGIDLMDLSDINTADVTGAYGIVEAIEGIYFCYGELQIGNGATTTYMDFSGDVLVFADKPVNSGLYAIRGEGSGCTITASGAVIRSAGSTDDTRFAFDMDDTNLNSLTMTGSFLTRAAACDFKSGQTVTGNTFYNCGQITAAGADFSDSIVRNYEGTTDTAAFVWNVNTDPDTYTDGMQFTKGTAATHAIEFGTSSPTTLNLSNIDFTGYNASDSQTSSTFLVSRTSGDVTINCSGCTGNLTYKSAGANVDIVTDPVTTEITVKDITDNSVIENAQVALWASDGTGDFDYQVSVTITAVGTTATVSDSDHTMTTGDFVLIEGANEYAYNGLYEVTGTTSTTYTYTMLSSPSSPATGTITATGGYFNTDTNASGIVTDTRSITNSQPVTGRVRKQDANGYYKTAPLSGTVSNSTGWSTTVFLIPDE